jgi:hypothetical protein
LIAHGIESRRASSRAASSGAHEHRILREAQDDQRAGDAILPHDRIDDDAAVMWL